MFTLLRFCLYILFLSMGLVGQSHDFGASVGQALWAIFVIWICFKIERHFRGARKEKDIEMLAEAFRRANNAPWRRGSRASQDAIDPR